MIPKPTAAVDASVWVSVLLPDDVHRAMTERWIAGWQPADVVVAPTLLLAEVAGAITRRTGQTSLGFQAAQEIRTDPRVYLVPIDDALAGDAAELAARLHVRGADAVYVAVARRFGVPLVTWDQEQLQRAAAVVATRTPAAV